MNCHRRQINSLEPFLVLPKSKSSVTCATASHSRIGVKHIMQAAEMKTELNKAVPFQYLKELYEPLTYTPSCIAPYKAQHF